MDVAGQADPQVSHTHGVATLLHGRDGNAPLVPRGKVCGFTCSLDDHPEEAQSERRGPPVLFDLRAEIEDLARREAVVALIALKITDVYQRGQQVCGCGQMKVHLRGNCLRSNRFVGLGDDVDNAQCPNHGLH